MARAVRDWDDHLGRRLRLRDLHILSNIAQWGSMAKAAKHLGISQPAVSEAIAQLEETLGVRLLDRSPRGIRPTIYGDALLRRGLVVFDELKQGIKEIESLADPGTGEVRIGCPEFLADGVVPAFIDQFSRRYPAAFVYVVDTPGVREDQQLRERKIDLLLARLPANSVSELEFDVEILFEERFFVVADARSQWFRRRKVTLADLINERWVLQPAQMAIRPLIDAAFRAHGLAVPREKVGTLSMHIRNHLIATGRYLTILPGSALHFNAKRWSVRALPLDLGINVPTGVVTLKHRALSPVVGRFIECARELVKSRAKTSWRGAMPDVGSLLRRDSLSSTADL